MTTLGAIYFREGRKITIPLPNNVLRFHPDLLHPPSGARRPAVVAAIQGWRGNIVAVQRIYLRADGLGKLPGPDAKLSKGPIGTDGSVRLASAADHMGVAEGIETALSAMELFGIPVWAGIGGRLDFWLPPRVRHVSIFADHDMLDMRETLTRTLPDGSTITRPNPMFGKRPGHVTAERARFAFAARNLSVDIPMPPTEGMDWNDILRQRAEASAA
jgi:hypothetical protein